MITKHHCTMGLSLFKNCIREMCPFAPIFQGNNCFRLEYLDQTWNLSKNLHRRIFRLKILHRQFHQISTVLVRKNTKNVWKWRNLHRWQKFYTAAGSDRMDIFHLWTWLKPITSYTMARLTLHQSQPRVLSRVFLFVGGWSSDNNHDCLIFWSFPNSHCWH